MTDNSDAWPQDCPCPVCAEPMMLQATIRRAFGEDTNVLLVQRASMFDVPVVFAKPLVLERRTV